MKLKRHKGKNILKQEAWGNKANKNGGDIRSEDIAWHVCFSIVANVSGKENVFVQTKKKYSSYSEMGFFEWRIGLDEREEGLGRFTDVFSKPHSIFEAKRPLCFPMNGLSI